MLRGLFCGSYANDKSENYPDQTPKIDHKTITIRIEYKSICHSVASPVGYSLQVV